MTSDTVRRLGLGALVGGPDEPGGGRFGCYADLARTLERGRFDALLIGEPAGYFEPLTLLAALSRVTEHIGLVAPASTTRDQPFHVARKFASLDHLSAGRAGWHTSAAHDEQGRAAEFAQVVRALWDSFDDGAVVRDKAAGRYYEPAGLRTPHHRGEHFAVRGPLNISRPPQGHPVAFHTEQPDSQQEFGARHAEVVLTGPAELGAAQAFYAEIKARAVAHGRDPAHVLVWPRLTPPPEAEQSGDLARGAVAPERIADHIEEWFRGHAADGFLVQLSGPAEDFVDHVVPLLRRRGLLGAGYEGGTLRENLGLPRPTARELQEAGR